LNHRAQAAGELEPMIFAPMIFWIQGGFCCTFINSNSKIDARPRMQKKALFWRSCEINARIMARYIAMENIITIQKKTSHSHSGKAGTGSISDGAGTQKTPLWVFSKWRHNPKSNRRIKVLQTKTFNAATLKTRR